MRSVRLPVAAATAAVVLVLSALLVAVALSQESALWKLVLVSVALAVPGALCAGLQPRNPVGWLLQTVALLFVAMSLATQLLEAGHGDAWAAWLADRAGALVVPLTLLTLVLLPDGRLPSARWRLVVAVVVAAQVAVVGAWSLVSGTSDSSNEPNPLGLLPVGWAGRVDALGDWVLQAPLLLVPVAVALRARRREDRGRLAPVLWAAAGFATLSVGGRLVWARGADALDVLGALLLAGGLTATVLPRSTTPATVPQPAAAPPVVPELSAREREVLALVAEGLTNREIAERLVISPVTARNHVSRILTKLDLDNRTQAATWLARSRVEG